METGEKQSEVTLYRCTCKHCDAAEEDLTRLTARYGMKFTVKSVNKEPYMADYAGWSTPMVYINGHKISHFTLSAKKWDAAMKQIGNASNSQGGQGE